MHPARLVIATHNPKKAGEMVMILAGRFPEMELLTLADFPGAPEPEETGDTYEENSRLKSESAYAFTGEWCLADDAGLEIDALEGAPGLYSKRFGGEAMPFPEKIARILHLMRDVSKPQRTARFQCYVALTQPGPASHTTRIFHASCEGRIGLEPSGGGGFGYDPIFFLPELKRTMADLTPEEKHAVSHRGKVLRQVADHLSSPLAHSRGSREITFQTSSARNGRGAGGEGPETAHRGRASSEQDTSQE